MVEGRVVAMILYSSRPTSWPQHFAPTGKPRVVYVSRPR